MPTRPTGNNLPVTITVDQNKPGYAIPATFEGLSYETGILTGSPDLEPGLLRIGGNTSDEISWTGKARTENTPADSLTTSDIDRLSAFSNAVGWQVLFGLNLANNNVSAATNEARYVHNSLKNNLYALQSGNEPDVFRLSARPPKYNYANYHQEWGTYLADVRKAVPQAPFAGPDVTPYNLPWINSFTKDENKNIKLIDGHYYDCGPASIPSINIQTILTANPKLASYLADLDNNASKYNLPYRISECNSVYGGGKAGVSDVFASALWALDFMWTVAENRGQGINFHGGDNRFAYTPIVVSNNTATARPEYYAMLAFKYGSAGGTIIPVTVSESLYNISAHACVNADDSYSITLINKEASSSFAFTIQLSKTASFVQIARLTAPGLNSTAATTFAGSTVNDDGTFAPLRNEQQTINQKSFVVSVPAGSAAVITVQQGCCYNIGSSLLSQKNKISISFSLMWNIFGCLE